MRISSKVLCTGALIIFGTAAHAGAQTSEVIRGCVGNNGTLKILSGSDQCGSRETAITWNVSGPAGPQGPQGPQGPEGPAGGGGLRVKNANGVEVGSLLDPSTPMGAKTLSKMAIDATLPLPPSPGAPSPVPPRSSVPEAARAAAEKLLNGVIGDGWPTL
jgi:hypothetical protein